MKIRTGVPGIFSLETEIPNISNIVVNSSWVANGKLLVGVNDLIFGVDEDEASGLACSYDEICKRVMRKGFFVNELVLKYSAIRIVLARQIVEFGLELESYTDPDAFLICELLYSNDNNWIPDGDAAFDDGSVIIHFDRGDQVYLIAFKASSELADIQSTLTELTIPATQFYSTLEAWRDKFEEICGIEAPAKRRTATFSQNLTAS